MVSRRKILSRSRDELHSDIYYMAEDDDDDVWHTKSKLYRVSAQSSYLLGISYPSVISRQYIL